MSHYAKNPKVRVYDLYGFLDGIVRTKKDTRNGDGLHYPKKTYNRILTDVRRFAG